MKTIHVKKPCGTVGTIKVPAVSRVQLEKVVVALNKKHRADKVWHYVGDVK